MGLSCISKISLYDSRSRLRLQIHQQTSRIWTAPRKSIIALWFLAGGWGYHDAFTIYSIADSSALSPNKCEWMADSSQTIH